MESNHLNQSTTPCYHVFAQLFNLEPSFLGKDVQFAGSLFPLQPLHFTAKLVLHLRIELRTSSLPKRCATTAPKEH